MPSIKTRILFVCLGNICRSPLAEGIFIDIVKRNNTEHLFDIDSAGTSDFHIGELPHHQTRKNAKINGLELVHKCRQFRREDFSEFDYIIVMDNSNRADVLSLKPVAETKATIHKMRFFDPLNNDADVPDPWYGGEEGFEEVFQILNRSCRSFYEVLMKR